RRDPIRVGGGVRAAVVRRRPGAGDDRGRGRARDRHPTGRRPAAAAAADRERIRSDDRMTLRARWVLIAVVSVLALGATAVVGAMAWAQFQERRAAPSEVDTADIV